MAAPLPPGFVLDAPATGTQPAAPSGLPEGFVLDAAPSAPAAPPATTQPDFGSQVLNAAIQSNPVTSGIKAGLDALPSWLRDALGRDASRVAGSLGDAIQLPMDTLTNKGGINDVQFDPMTGKPQPFNDQTLERASNAAGWMTGGELEGGLPKTVTADGLPVPRKVLSAVARDGIPVDQVGARVADLGPAGKVADIGDNAQKLAMGIATQPGTPGATISNALKARATDATTRVPAAVNDVLGPATPPSQIAGDIKANKQAVSPEYTQALDGAARVHVSTLAANLDAQIASLKGPALAAAKSVREMLNVNGANASDLGDKLETSPESLLEVRNAIDEMFASGATGKTRRVLADARDQVDAILAAAAPDIKGADAKYRELSRQSDALDQGGQVLDGGKTAVWPVDNAKAVAEGVQPEGTLVGPSATTFRLKQGARADIERIVGTKTNDRVALANIIQGESDWNPQKLAQLFGQDKADAIMKVVQNERQMAETENLARTGSKTAAATAAQNDLAPANGVSGIIRAGGWSPMNAVFAAGANVVDKVSGGMATKRNQNIADVIMGRGDWQRKAGTPTQHLSMPMEALIAAVNRQQGASQ